MVKPHIPRAHLAWSEACCNTKVKRGRKPQATPAREDQTIRHNLEAVPVPFVGPGSPCGLKNLDPTKRLENRPKSALCRPASPSGDGPNQTRQGLGQAVHNLSGSGHPPACPCGPI